MAQYRTCNLSAASRPSSPLRHVFKVPPDHVHHMCVSIECHLALSQDISELKGSGPLHA
jgi:hypothetical protein